MKTFKAFLALLLALAFAVAGGWVWGAAGRSRAEDALAKAGAGLHLAHAQGDLLAARVNLFELNFGEALKSLERSRADLTTVAETFDRMRLTQEAAAAREAVARVVEAQRLAGRLDQAANTRIAEAIRLLPKMP